MSKPLVYVDQNVLGLLAGGRPKLVKDSSVQFVYSNEHFEEINRSTHPTQYLTALESIDAKLLQRNLDTSWKIIGDARLIEEGTPSEHFQRYLKSSATVSFDGSDFAVFQAWVNGGGDNHSMSAFPDKVVESLSTLIKEYSLEDKIDCNKIANLRDALKKHHRRISRARE